MAAYIAPIQLQLRVAGGDSGRHRQVDLALAFLPAQHQWLAETEFAQGHLPVHRTVAAPFGELASDGVSGMGSTDHARQDERGGGGKQGSGRSGSWRHFMRKGLGGTATAETGRELGKGMPRSARRCALARPSP